MNDKKIIKTIREIYIQMYHECDPPAEFEGLETIAETLSEDWYMDYFLPMKRQCEIIDEVCKKNKITKREQKAVSVSVHLGCAPNSCYETWLERVREFP